MDQCFLNSYVLVLLCLVLPLFQLVNETFQSAFPMLSFGFEIQQFHIHQVRATSVEREQ